VPKSATKGEVQATSQTLITDILGATVRVYQDAAFRGFRLAAAVLAAFVSARFCLAAQLRQLVVVGFNSVQRRSSSIAPDK
jgi:hypothetical protein